MRHAVLLSLLSLCSLFAFSQTTVTLSPSKDNTLFESPTGSLSNGAGPHMYAGMTNTGNIRRAVLAFDIASTVPSTATITSVTLTLNVSQSATGSGNQNHALHRLTADWGEGTSNAGTPGGGGAPSATNDATWIHTFFNTSFWTSNGGDFNGTASAITSVGNPGPYDWSSAQLTTDVQNMLNNPGNNFGWILIGNEVSNQTAKRFDSKENSNPGNRPELEITYTLPIAAQDLIINEVDYDQPSTDTAEFIELLNADASSIDLSNYEVELVNGSNGSVYQTIQLPSVSLAPGEYFVICANNSTTPNCDLQVSPATNLIQNGAPDAVAVKFNGTTIVDAVSYEGNTAAPYTEGSGVGLEDNGSQVAMGISRFPDGTDTDMNNQDFTFRCITPGLANEGPNITVMAPGGTQICPGGSAQLTSSGASNSPQWLHNGQPIPGATNTSYTATQPGTYNVMANYSFCRDSAAAGITITLATPPVVDLGPDTTVCGSYLLDAGNPGATYLWNTGLQNRFLNVLNSGTYSVTATLNGCTDSDTIQVTVGAPFNINLPDTVQGCEEVTLNPGTVAGASYMWSTGATTQSITVNTSGKYWVDVTRTGCHRSDTAYADVVSLPDVDAGLDVSVCDSAMLLATSATPNVTFSWSTGASGPGITVFAAGEYVVTATDAFGCSATDTVEVTLLPKPTVDLGPDFQGCNQATLDAGNPGSSYLWSTGETTQQITVTTSGTYHVTVTNLDGCIGIDTVNVTIAQSLNINLGPDTSACERLVLNAGVPGATYNWNTGDNTQTIEVTSSGTYSVTVTQIGCSSADTVNVTIKPNPTVDLGPDQTACEFAVLQATGGTWDSLQWNVGATTNPLTVNMSGTYMVTVFDDGCTSSDTVSVTIDTMPVVDLGPDTAICGMQHSLDAGNAGASFMWSTGAQTQQITVTGSGMHSVTVTNGFCASEDTVNITLNPIPVLSLGADIDLCQGDSATLEGNITGSYEWSTGETADSIKVAQGGFYSATVTDANGCMDSDTVQVNVIPIPVFNLGADTTVCDSITLSASGGVTYEWQDGSTLSTYTATGSGTYSVTVTNASGCQSSDEINVTINVSPVAGFSFDTTGCPDVVFTNLSSGTAPGYDWDFGDGMGTSNDPDPTYTYDSNGTYVVVLMATNTCGTATFTDTVGIDCYPNGIELPESDAWKVYPNPATNLLVIEAQAGTQPAQWHLYDIGGRLLRQGEVNSTTQVSLDGISAGTYLMLVRNEQTDSRIPVVVIR